MADRYKLFRDKEEFISTRRVNAMVLNALRYFCKDILYDFRRTAQYWVHQPRFEQSIKYKGGNIQIDVLTSGDAKGTKYWKYVNNGTLRRKVVFNRKYVPKTAFPGSIGTNTPGQYTTITDNLETSKIIDKTWGWMPGIRARKWTELVYDIYEPLLPVYVQDAINIALNPKGTMKHTKRKVY